MTALILFTLLVAGLAFFLAAVVDRRDKTLAYRGGSSELAIYLDGTQAPEATGDPSAVAGWYVLGYLEGGEIGPARDSEEIKDEADVLVANPVTRDEFDVSNTVMQTDDETLAILTWLEDAANGVPGRYPLPTNTTGTSQWFFFYVLNARIEDWRLNTSREGLRTRDFTLFATRDGSGNLYDIATLGSDQGAAEWDSYGTFKDTPV